MAIAETVRTVMMTANQLDGEGGRLRSHGARSWFPENI
jgi:hypothetical protein